MIFLYKRYMYRIFISRHFFCLNTYRNSYPLSPYYYALRLRERLESSAVIRDLNELFGERTIRKSQVEIWFKKYEFGDTNFADDEGRDRWSNFGDKTLSAAVDEDEWLSTRMLAEDFNVAHSIIVRHLKKLGKLWKLVV